jgi:hypothetical protein
MEVPKGERGTRNVFKEILTKNFPNLGKDMNIQIHESLRIPRLTQRILQDTL